MKTLSLLVNWPLDSETVDSIVFLRKLRMANIRQLLKNPKAIDDMLKVRGIIKDYECLKEQDIVAELSSNLQQLENYQDFGAIHLDELEDYLEILQRRKIAARKG